MKKFLSVVLATLLVIMPTLQINIFAAPTAVSIAEAAIESQTNTEAFEEDVSELSETGTKYYIYSADDLANVANDLTGIYYLMNDIDLSSYENWTPIGTSTEKNQYFAGLFDGNGHTVSGLTIQGSGYAYSGLFGVSAGVIRNLNVEATIIDEKTAGALAGFLYYGATVENCSSSGSVAGTSDIGGLIGRAESYSSGNTILIRNCYSMASATNTSTDEGNGCGGLVGEIYGNTSNSMVKIVSCYAAGKVTKTGTTGVGGLVGYSRDYNGSHAILASYYCSSTTKQGDTNRGFTATSTQMKQQSTYANWDFENIWGMDESINSGFPYLKLTGEYNKFSLTGSGEKGDPYIITTEAQLAAIARGEVTNSFTAYYKLGNDITLTSNYWTPIGTNGMPYFSGCFDGGGHTIYNVNICVPAYGFNGLFGRVTGTIKNLNITANISDVATSGALAGLLHYGATIENCSSSGSVAGTSDIGGLIGRAESYSSGNTILIRNCYSMASATNTSTDEGNGCGGLVGEIYGNTSNSMVKIVNCYAAGKVKKTGTTGVGGLVGYSRDYNGSHAILASYYCSSTTKQGDTNRGFTATSTQMKQQSTYANWDFDNIWDINSSINNGYPYLKLTGEYNTFEMEGSGTSRDPYIVTTEAELAAIARGEITNNYTAYYQLGNDITLSSNYWTPIGGNGMPYFSGCFDGAGYTIYNVNICVPAYGFSGLFGRVQGTIKNLNVTANISDVITAGALTGHLYYGATVKNCSSSGSVAGTSDIGGLIGRAESYSSGNTILIRNCYSMASATNTSTDEGNGCGGLVGEIYGNTSNSMVKIVSCYAAGKVTKTGTTGVGGLVGYSRDYNGSHAILASYYAEDLTMQNDKERAFGVPSAKLLQKSTFANWDFENIWDINPSVNNGYPYLKLTGEYNTFELEGSGTSRDPYIVTTEAELAAIARGEITNNYTAYYQLGNDITLSSNYWTPIGGNGMPCFSGCFDGAGFMIYNVNICAPAYVTSGLFGDVSGTIKNLGVTANISNGVTVGALAGAIYQTATVENCYSDGNVSGSSNAGGLIGLARTSQSSSTISITNSYSMANASSTNTSNDRGCGGLVGWAYGYSSGSTVKIENCYATGNVTKSSTTGLGGLVGLASKYYGSYTILSSYYDNYTDSSTDKGTYVSSEDMKNQSNYAIWDFENVWAISDALNEGYPYLQILVPAGAISVTDVSINKLSTTLTVGESEVLTVTILPTNASNQNVKWTSSNENVVTVTDGVIEAIDTGVATITVETIDGGKTATCTVTVKEKGSTDVNVTGISLNKSSLDLVIGDTAGLTATVTPTNATNKAVTWTSTNDSVATVSANGVVTAVDAGDAVIIVTTNDGGKTAFCSVSVSGIPTVEPEEPDEPDTPIIPDKPEEPVEYKATMTLSDVSGRQGETVKVIVSLKTDEIINTIGIRDISYDTSVLTFAGFSDYEELQNLCQLSQFDESKMAVVAALKNAQDFDGTLCALNFIINEDAEECEIEVGAVANIKFSHDTIATEVVPATVTVRSQILGDLNLDEYVDMNDAILLLQYSMFPDLYPLEYRGSVDFTNDGFIDMNDAILLLQYSMFPDLYPIQ